MAPPRFAKATYYAKNASAACEGGATERFLPLLSTPSVWPCSTRRPTPQRLLEGGLVREFMIALLHGLDGFDDGCRAGPRPEDLAEAGACIMLTKR